VAQGLPRGERLDRAAPHGDQGPQDPARLSPDGSPESGACGGLRSAAMAMVGHRTESIYRRYAIVDEAMLREGAEKLQRLHDQVIRSSPLTRLRTVPTPSQRAESRGLIGRGTARQSRENAEAGMVGWDGIEPPTPGFSVRSRRRRARLTLSTSVVRESQESLRRPWFRQRAPVEHVVTG
jgi:hypothetical protein